MPGRCACGGAGCSCAITGGAGVTVTGTGTADRPYVLTTAPVFANVFIEDPDPVYFVGDETPLGTQSTIVIDSDGSRDRTFALPGNSSSGAEVPPPGSILYVLVVGQTDFTSTFEDDPILWMSAPAGGDGGGLYCFVLTQDAQLGTFWWLGYFIGAPAA